MTVVVDASYAGPWLLPDEASEDAEEVLASVVAGREELAVPGLWDYELTNLLVIAHRRGRIDEPQIEEGQRLLQEIPKTRYGHDELLSQHRVARFAQRFSLSGYDAAYLELVDRLQCVLHTNDGPLQNAAASLGLAPPGQ